MKKKKRETKSSVRSYQRYIRLSAKLPCKAIAKDHLIYHYGSKELKTMISHPIFFNLTQKSSRHSFGFSIIIVILISLFRKKDKRIFFYLNAFSVSERETLSSWDLQSWSGKPINFALRKRSRRVSDKFYRVVTSDKSDVPICYHQFHSSSLSLQSR